MDRGGLKGVWRWGREGVGQLEGLRWREAQGALAAATKDVLVSLDLFDLVAADEDLELGSSFDGVEVHLNFDSVSGHQSPKAAGQGPVRAWNNCWG